MPIAKSSWGTGFPASAFALPANAACLCSPAGCWVSPMLAANMFMRKLRKFTAVQPKVQHQALSKNGLWIIHRDEAPTLVIHLWCQQLIHQVIDLGQLTPGWWRVESTIFSILDLHSLPISDHSPRESVAYVVNDFFKWSILYNDKFLKQSGRCCAKKNTSVLSLFSLTGHHRTVPCELRGFNCFNSVTFSEHVWLSVYPLAN